MALNAQHVHFIGVGGIGMSALATILAERGVRVSGCDADASFKGAGRLKALGCAVHPGNDSVACSDPSIDLVVCSTAINRNSPEVVRAVARGVRIISRAELLAELMREKYSIAVSGSHGKTTTSALIAHILIEAQLDPTVLVGGIMGNLGHNARSGQGSVLVAEADESDRSFTLLNPSIAVITNIDREHLDTYRDLADVQATFRQFVARLPNDGIAVLCADDPGAAAILPQIRTTFTGSIITYGRSTEVDVQLTDCQLTPSASRISIRLQDGARVETSMPTPGEHHAYNAIAAAAVARACGVTPDLIGTAIRSFLGVDQRFSYRGLFQGAEIFDDYGHHPTEIAHMLTVARRRTHGKLIVVFQPHRFSRTQRLWHEFVTTFSSNSPDLLIVTDIHPASEAPIEGVTGAGLAAAVKAQYLSLDADYAEIEKTLAQTAHEGDLILFLGAGKINRLSEKLTAHS
ncbi:MAG: UDP-N-acetylmuramate--L-alanine ligase [Candidatus Dependentiae bacterium]|nr:UDP-N-acetylmuramate--L-alanine ligase [Candidatus Dependentiae bacterium]